MSQTAFFLNDEMILETDDKCTLAYTLSDESLVLLFRSWLHRKRQQHENDLAHHEQLLYEVAELSLHYQLIKPLFDTTPTLKIVSGGSTSIQ